VTVALIRTGTRGLSSWPGDASPPEAEYIYADCTFVENYPLAVRRRTIHYYSRWTPYDAWGLDTPEFARKLIQPEQVTGLHPDLAIVHDGSQSCTLQVHPRQTSRDWINMTDNIETGLTNLGAYDAWKVPYIAGRQGTNPRALKKLAADHLCFYVAQGYAGHDQFERILQKHGAVRVSAP
jgi:hypothetical protein